MSSDDPHPLGSTSRRTVLCGSAVAGLGLVTTGCFSDLGPLPEGPTRRPTPTGPVELGAVDEVLVGRARIFANERIVVTQPTDGEFLAFGAECTHQGCLCSHSEGTDILCPCHGSRFDGTTGEVIAGPARRPLPKVPVRVRDGRLVAGPE